MKKGKTLICTMLATAMLAASCVSEDVSGLAPGSTDQATGWLMFNLKSDVPFTSDTRALNEDIYRNTDNYTVQLIQASNKSLVFECKAADLNTYLPRRVPIGEYEVKAWFGKEHDASRDEFLVEGEKNFTIKSGEDHPMVTVNCIPTCGKLMVAFDSSMDTYYNSYNVTFSGTKQLGSKTIEWKKGEIEPWYIALDKAGETVKYTIDLTVKDDYAHINSNGEKTTTGKIEGSFKLQRNHAQKLTLKPNYIPGEDGALDITITIDDSTIDKTYDWEVPTTWIY